MIFVNQSKAHNHTDVCIYLYVLIRVCILMQCMYKCVHVHMYVCTCVYMYLCMYVHMCICTYVCLYICICIYMYVHVYICIYI